MKNRSIFSVLIVILLLAGIAILFEGGIVFFKSLSISNNDSFVIDDFSNDGNIINIKLDNKYVEKIELSYSTNDDVAFDVISVDKNNNSIVVHENFDNEIKKQVINIKKYVKKISIESNDLNNVKINKIYVDNHIRFNYLVCFYIYSCFLLIYVMYYMIKNGCNNKNIHRYFFVVGLIVGLVFIILQPSTTYYSWDDQIHFSNVYELHGGNVNWNIGEFSMVDASPIGRGTIYSYEDYLNQKKFLNHSTRIVYNTSVGRMITYSKLVYIPASIGYYVSKLLGFPFSVCFRIGKVMILLSYLLIMSYAIKISKIGKKLLVVLGLIPSSMFLATQYSYDPAVISGSVLASVLLVNWFADKRSVVDFKTMSLFLFALLYASFVKGVYIPILLLFLFVPKSRFKSVKTCRYVKIFSLILLLLIMYTFVMPTVGNGAIAGDARGGDTSVAGQISWILGHPFDYTIILFKNMLNVNYYFGVGAFIFFAYIGTLNNYVYYLFLGLLVFIILTENNKYKLKFGNKLLFLVITFGIIVLIWTALYLSFTPVGKGFIDGVQPRYFLPLLYLIFVCFEKPVLNFKISEKMYNSIVFVVPIIVLMVSIFQLILVKMCL